MKVRIGTRKSILALKQTELVANAIRGAFPGTETEALGRETSGDKNLSSPLSAFGGKGAFVTEFEDALLEGKIDMAVHSAKDLPAKIADGLCIAAVLKREDARDVIVWRKGAEKSEKSVIGTSSPRRALQIRGKLGCTVRTLRGNVGTRLTKLEAGEFDGIILAAAGLKRLGILSDGGGEICEKFDVEILGEDEFCPAGGQGIIAIECAESNAEMRRILEKICDETAFIEFCTERKILALLGSGCHDPTAVFAKVRGGEITVSVVVEQNGKPHRITMRGQTADSGRIAEKIAAEAEKALAAEKTRVYLVGSGPGDDSLATQKAVSLIKNADAVVYDALANPALLSYAKTGCSFFPVGKIPGKHSKTQDEINEILVDLAKSGKFRNIVRLKGGDPFVFGRGGEEAEHLSRNGIAYETVPGVTSAIAALECAGIPVTHRGESRSFCVITGHTADGSESFVKYAGIGGTLVFLMGVANIKKIADDLLSGGMDADTPAAIVENGTTARQRRTNGTISTIAQIALERNVSNPAVIAVGKTAAFDMRCGILPLSGRRICITGTRSFVQKVGAEIEGSGAAATLAPILRTELDERAFDTAFVGKHYDKNERSFRNVDWLVFTSSNGVRLAFRRMFALGIDIRALSRIQFCVVGSGTADALAEFGITADFVPKSGFTVAEMEKEFSDFVGGGKNIVALRAAEGSPLGNSGIKIEDIPIYTTKADKNALDSVSAGASSFDAVTFASSLGVKSFFGFIPPESFSENAKFICIGGKTRATLEQFVPREKIVTAGECTANGIARALFESL